MNIVETSKDLFKELETAEKLFLDGSIKNAQKIVRSVFNKAKNFKNIPNKLKHKLNAAINQSRYFDDISSFATNPKRDKLISMVNKLIEKPLEDPRKHAHAINNIQGQWQLLDISSKSASKDQWLKFNELTNTAWESCKEYFDEIKELKINNAAEREKIINEINSYVASHENKWPAIKDLSRYLNQMFHKWQNFAPVLDKDLHKLKKLYFESRKPINKEILKQEKINKEKKELLIQKVNEINDDDSQVCINKFKDLKNDWQKIGPAGKRDDPKLWSRFNKDADKFFAEKKQVVNDETLIVLELINDLKSDKKSVSEIENELKILKNISNTKELKTIKNLIESKKKIQLQKNKDEKLLNYKNIYNILMGNDSIENVHNVFKGSIEAASKNNKSNLDELIYSCIKLEILAKLDSLKKYQELRNIIQLELLQNKFNKTDKANLDNIDSIICHYIINFSSSDAATDHKKLWNRMEKCFDVLI